MNLRRTYSFYFLNKRPGPLFARPWGAVVRVESFAWNGGPNSYFTPKAVSVMQQATSCAAPSLECTECLRVRAAASTAAGCAANGESNY